MNDLLQRLLAVDKQGDEAIKAAEEKAVQLREAAATRIAAMNADFSKALTAECAAIEKAAIEEAQRQRAAELVAAQQQVAAKRSDFAKALAPCQPRLLEELLGLAVVAAAEEQL